MSLGVFEIGFPSVTPFNHGGAHGGGADGSVTAVPPRSFLTGDENRLPAVALAALSADAETPFYPLTLHGPPGVGKSHLGLALACEFQQRRPAARVLHVCGSDFARDYAEAVDRRTMHRFREGYRTAAMLVLDGLDQLAEKAAAQQELLWTIDVLAQESARVIVICTAPPHELPWLLPALRDRLTGGLCMPVAAPGLATRLAILRRFAAGKGIALPDSAAEALAAGLALPAGPLCGALVRLACEQTDLGEPLDEVAVRRFMARQSLGRQPTVREIARRTARHFGLTLADLKGPSRQRKVAVARSLAVYLARRHTSESFQSIGRFFGGRDHTTALHSVGRIEELLATDPAVRAALAMLNKSLMESV